LDGGNGTGFRTRNLYQPPSARLFLITNVEVIPDEVKKWFVANEVGRAKNRMAITQRLLLGNETQPPHMIPHHLGKGCLVTGRDDHGDFLDSCAQRLLHKNRQDRLLISTPIHEHLHRQGALIPTSRCDYCFPDIHWTSSITRSGQTGI
jgi:hypothetical protein